MEHQKDITLPKDWNEEGSSKISDASEMLRLRYWQHILNEMMKQKKFKIPIHLGFGHEAAAVALDRCIDRNDVICLTHRNAVYNLLRSKSLETILEHYQLVQKPGQSAFMGSMNLAANNSSIAYTSSILCNNLPVAAGIAMNRKLTKKTGVVFVLTGDGAIEEGAFWETLVFAHSHRLALVIIIENNDHSMSSTIEQRRTEINLASVCAGIGLSYYGAQGAEVDNVKRAIAAARTSAIGGKPVCVELQLSTFNQHAGPTPGWPDDPLRIALEDGLLIKEDLSDPIYRVQQALGMVAYEQLVQKIVEMEKDSEKHLY